VSWWSALSPAQQLGAAADFGVLLLVLAHFVLLFFDRWRRWGADDEHAKKLGGLEAAVLRQTKQIEFWTNETVKEQRTRSTSRRPRAQHEPTLDLANPTADLRQDPGTFEMPPDPTRPDTAVMSGATIRAAMDLLHADQARQQAAGISPAPALVGIDDELGVLVEASGPLDGEAPDLPELAGQTRRP